MGQSNLRREAILKSLKKTSEPQKGTNLASEFAVTRQIIVKDIAILRAEGHNIIATPDGYIMKKNITNKIKKIIAVNHGIDEVENELKMIVSYGGIIEDVIVEHPLYGEIRAMLMIRNLNELNKFMKKFKEINAQPLSVLTGGVHIHTISTESEEDMSNILKELKKKQYLISE
ncbi:transcriptional regulator [Clostridium polyendosporum]|uniref:Transcriptional regulator n=1 Tax=Clostridium polyendosporum TaxID=69208 RepID=A0A919S047_9CLOT|nr:transcription repressor NadR [Clostridium polyendosporum]GIM29392.1 transcriptional regulator [Clostridium polyendosporum]